MARPATLILAELGTSIPIVADVVARPVCVARISLENCVIKQFRQRYVAIDGLGFAELAVREVVEERAVAGHVCLGTVYQPRIPLQNGDVLTRDPIARFEVKLVEPIAKYVQPPVFAIDEHYRGLCVLSLER